MDVSTVIEFSQDEIMYLRICLDASKCATGHAAELELKLRPKLQWLEQFRGATAKGQL